MSGRRLVDPVTGSTVREQGFWGVIDIRAVGSAGEEPKYVICGEDE